MSLLEVDQLTVFHGQVQALTDFSISVDEGETVAVIGANGAGKSTLLRALAGVLAASPHSLRFDGRDLTTVPAHRRVSAGIAMVPEGRRLFASLSLEENLQTGTYRGRPGPWSVARVMQLFDWMPDRRRVNASRLSGGQQQAVAIGRALVSNPRLLLIDELSLGLAPVVVKQVYAILPQIVAEGTAILLVEQDVSQALRVANRVSCLLEGRTMLEGRPRDLTMPQIEAAYFGVSHPDAAGPPAGSVTAPTARSGD